jgi:hypothetical protein
MIRSLGWGSARGAFAFQTRVRVPAAGYGGQWLDRSAPPLSDPPCSRRRRLSSCGGIGIGQRARPRRRRGAAGGWLPRSPVEILPVMAVIILGAIAAVVRRLEPLLLGPRRMASASARSPGCFTGPGGRPANRHAQPRPRQRADVQHNTSKRYSARETAAFRGGCFGEHRATGKSVVFPGSRSWSEPRLPFRGRVKNWKRSRRRLVSCLGLVRRRPGSGGREMLLLRSHVHASGVPP